MSIFGLMEELSIPVVTDWLRTKQLVWGRMLEPNTLMLLAATGSSEHDAEAWRRTCLVLGYLVLTSNRALLPIELTYRAFTTIATFLYLHETSGRCGNPNAPISADHIDISPAHTEALQLTYAALRAYTNDNAAT